MNFCAGVGGWLLLNAAAECIGDGSDEDSELRYLFIRRTYAVIGTTTTAASLLKGTI